MQFLLLMASNPAKFPPNTVLCFSLKKRKGENKLNKMDNFQFLEFFLRCLGVCSLDLIESMTDSR